MLSIISVTTYSAVLSKDDSPRDKLNTAGKSIFAADSTSSGSWLGFFFKIFLFAAVCAGAFYGYQHYVARNGHYGMRGLGSFYTNGKRF